MTNKDLSVFFAGGWKLTGKHTELATTCFYSTEKKRKNGTFTMGMEKP